MSSSNASSTEWFPLSGLAPALVEQQVLSLEARRKDKQHRLPSTMVHVHKKKNTAWYTQSRLRTSPGKSPSGSSAGRAPPPRLHRRCTGGSPHRSVAHTLRTCEHARTTRRAGSCLEMDTGPRPGGGAHSDSTHLAGPTSGERCLYSGRRA
jgi:hypothetical protein